jgi:hypothetical protein
MQEYKTYRSHLNVLHNAVLYETRDFKTYLNNMFGMFPCCLRRTTVMRIGFRQQGGYTSNYKLASQRTTAALIVYYHKLSLK